MKITNNTNPNLASIDSAKLRTTDVKTNSAKNSPLEDLGDDAPRVGVSERARMMQKAKDIASSADTVDETKVAHFQKLIDEGKYSVDAGKLADKIVDEQLLYPGE